MLGKNIKIKELKILGEIYMIIGLLCSTALYWAAGVILFENSKSVNILNALFLRQIIAGLFFWVW